MTTIDARGLRHPSHIRAFRDEFAGLCTVFQGVEILIDDLPEERRTLEMFIRSCRGSYTVEKMPGGHLHIRIEPPFHLCG